MGLTMEQFGGLYGSCERHEAKETIDRFWLERVSANGNAKQTKGALAPFENKLKRLRAPTNDAKAFQNKFGGGF